MFFLRLAGIRRVGILSDCLLDEDLGGGVGGLGGGVGDLGDGVGDRAGDGVGDLLSSEISLSSFFAVMSISVPLAKTTAVATCFFDPYCTSYNSKSII